MQLPQLGCRLHSRIDCGNPINNNKVLCAPVWAQFSNESKRWFSISNSINTDIRSLIAAHEKLWQMLSILVRQRFAYTRIPILASFIRPTQCDLSIGIAPFDKSHRDDGDISRMDIENRSCGSRCRVFSFFFVFVHNFRKQQRKKKRNFIFGNRRPSEIKLSLKINTIHRSFHHNTHLHTLVKHTRASMARGREWKRERERMIDAKWYMSLWASHF